MADAGITVGEAARRAGVSPRAVSLYEAKGILPPAERTASGYRTYSDHDVQVLRFVRRARGLGLRLEEIGRILDLQRRGTQPCGTVIQLLDGHRRDIDRAIKELRALRKDLAAALAVAESSVERRDDVVVCPTIESPAGDKG